MRKNKLFLVLLFAISDRVRAQPAPQPPYSLFTSPRGTFSCDIPTGWRSFEIDTPTGFAAHIVGPAEAGGAWRAALHVHFVEKGRPGFLPVESAIKAERASNKPTARDSSAVSRLRIAGNLARRFEITETRELPDRSLPAQPVVLHHYYALIADGSDYFIVKLSTTRETYLNYRDSFEHILSTFRILGRPQ